MSDQAQPVMPNDPSVTQGIVADLNSLIQQLGTYLANWQQEVDAKVVQLQNATASQVQADGSVTGQVPPDQLPPPAPQPVDTTPVDTTTAPSTEPTASSTDTTTTAPTDTTTSPPEDTGTASPTTSTDTGVEHHFIDPSGDDTITDPSHDDVQQ